MSKTFSRPTLPRARRCQLRRPSVQDSPQKPRGASRLWIPDVTRDPARHLLVDSPNLPELICGFAFQVLRLPGRRAVPNPQAQSGRGAGDARRWQQRLDRECWTGKSFLATFRSPLAVDL